MHNIKRIYEFRNPDKLDRLKEYFNEKEIKPILSFRKKGKKDTGNVYNYNNCTIVEMHSKNRGKYRINTEIYLQRGDIENIIAVNHELEEAILKK